MKADVAVLSLPKRIQFSLFIMMCTWTSQAYAQSASQEFFKNLQFKNDSWDSARLALGISAIVLALTFIGWMIYQRSTEEKRGARRRWDENQKRQAQNQMATTQPKGPAEAAFLQRQQNLAAAPEPLSNYHPQEPPSSVAAMPAAPQAVATPHFDPSPSSTSLGGLPEVAMAAASLVDSTFLEVNQELSVFGKSDRAGQCDRGMIVHLDEKSILVKLLGESVADHWSTGDQLQGYVWRENDTGYLFETVVCSSKKGEDSFLLLSRPVKVEQRKKRLFVRVPYRGRASFLHVSNSQAGQLASSEERPGGIHEGLIDNLSAGGFRIVTNANMKVGDYVSIDEFEPANGHEILARVSACKESSGDADYGRYGLQYVGMSAELRECITKEVFRLQREDLQRRQEESNST